MQHSDCNVGEYCSPQGFDGSLDPSECYDCFGPEYALSKESNYGQTEEYWLEAARFCNVTDTMPTRCDHLFHNRYVLSMAGLIVLVFSAVVALIPALQDLDQASDEMLVMAARNAFTPPLLCFI